jgi:hypothetical protein
MANGSDLDDGRKAARDIVETAAFLAMQKFRNRLNESGCFPHTFTVGGPQPQDDGAFACICAGRASGYFRQSGAPLASFRITASAKIENESMLRLDITCEVATLPTQAWTELYRSKLPLFPVALGHQSARERYEEELGQCYDKYVQFYQKLKASP